jgi:hypothetical protein
MIYIEIESLKAMSQEFAAIVTNQSTEIEYINKSPIKNNT